MHRIERLTDAQTAEAALPQLIALLRDAVEGGASVGFLHPLDQADAERYWRDVFREVGDGSRILLVARRDCAIVGSAQLALCTRPNGLHRAEVQKLFVHTRHRRQGIARTLMTAIESEARAARRSLLHLDTEADKPAERMYAAMGWTRVGTIPAFAASPDGALHGTVVFYREL